MPVLGLAVSDMTAISMLRLTNVLCLLGCASFLGCATPRTLPLRVDPTELDTSRRPLSGVKIAIRSVIDARPEGQTLGAHRDGLLRVHDVEYVTGRPPQHSVERILSYCLTGAGAWVIAPQQPADLVVDVTIRKLWVTVDGELAGEETFGEVSLDVTLSKGNGEVLGKRTFAKAFAYDERQDPGLLGDVIRMVSSDIVTALLPPNAERPVAQR